MAYPEAMILDMYASYARGLSLHRVASLWCVDRSSVGAAFRRRGLKIRFRPMGAKCPRSGRILPYVPYTKAQLDELVRTAKSVTVPACLRQEWRHWSLNERAAFVARLRGQVAWKACRPTTPYSAGLVEFDFGSPEAHAIAAVANAGRGSRDFKTRIGPRCAGGVIYRGQLWFWTAKVGYCLSTWTPGAGRPVLHRVIWEEANGRPVPPSCVVSFVDGNPNNHEPGNLVLRSRNDLCRTNQATALLRRSRAATAALLQQAQEPHHEHAQVIAQLSRHRRNVSS